MWSVRYSRATQTKSWGRKPPRGKVVGKSLGKGNIRDRKGQISYRATGHLLQKIRSFAIERSKLPAELHTHSWMQGPISEGEWKGSEFARASIEDLRGKWRGNILDYTLFSNPNPWISLESQTDSTSRSSDERHRGYHISQENLVVTKTATTDHEDSRGPYLMSMGETCRFFWPTDDL